MNFQDVDPGQLSEEAAILTSAFILIGNISDSLPALQIVSYAVGITIGLGTILINRNKYIKELKEIFKKAKNGFKKTK